MPKHPGAYTVREAPTPGRKKGEGMVSAKLSKTSMLMLRGRSWALETGASGLQREEVPPQLASQITPCSHANPHREAEGKRALCTIVLTRMHPAGTDGSRESWAGVREAGPAGPASSCWMVWAQRSQTP